jgi:endoglucanase
MSLLNTCVTLGLALGVAGCAQFKPPQPGSEKASGGGGSCAKKALIEDGEDGDDQIIVREGRGGYLYTFADERGTKVEPAGELKPSGGGADGSHKSLHVTAQLVAGEAYAGLGLSLRDPAGPYDASKYKGLVFYARRSADSAPAVRLMISDANTEPAAGVCTDCFNDFGVTFELNEEWTRYVVRFDDLKQEGGWGAPRPETIDASKLYAVKWQTTAANAKLDLWIDQVGFLCE